jgi:pimeloyl-ACP methyl ester carboxylesterase
LVSNGRLRAVACALALAATIAGCSSTSSPRTGAPGPSATTLRPPGAGCPVEAAKGTAMRLTSPSGNSIATVVLGGGTSAVVLAHQNHEDLCQWLPYGERLAGLGYRVLAFDFVGFGNSTYRTDKTYVEDITTVVTYLRGQGVTKVVLIGASMGGTMTVAAAASITPPVDGIVALSAPSVFDGVDAAPHCVYQRHGRALRSRRVRQLLVARLDGRGRSARLRPREFAGRARSNPPDRQRHILRDRRTLHIRCTCRGRCNKCRELSRRGWRHRVPMIRRQRRLRCSGIAEHRPRS